MSKKYKTRPSFYAFIFTILTAFLRLSCVFPCVSCCDISLTRFAEEIQQKTVILSVIKPPMCYLDATFSDS